MRKSEKLKLMLMLAFMVNLTFNFASAQSLKEVESTPKSKPVERETASEISVQEKPYMKMVNFKPESPDPKMNMYRHSLLEYQYKLSEVLAQTTVSSTEVAYYEDLIQKTEALIALHLPQEQQLILEQEKHRMKSEGIEIKEETVSTPTASTPKVKTKPVPVDTNAALELIKELQTELQNNSDKYTPYQIEEIKKRIAWNQNRIANPEIMND